MNRVADAAPAAARPHAPAHQGAVSGPLIHEIDDFDLPSFASVAAGFGEDRYGFVVTPNVDHLVRLHEDAKFRHAYLDAEYVLLDSRFASLVLRFLKGVKLRVCTGSDLTATLFWKVIAPPDRILLVGGSSEQAATITRMFDLKNVRHYNPPMGFIRNPEELERCLQFIERESPFRFCFLAVGSPQQEIVARMLRERGIARGLALCVGASLNFITGSEKRAPLWMQRFALEWLYRLAQNPKRMASRYLIRGPRFFNYLRRSRFVARRAAATAA
jgi:exopolysaccharide biosynthesis WecB/TagA/CpsF family protein